MDRKHNIMCGNKWKATTLKSVKVMQLHFLVPHLEHYEHSTPLTVTSNGNLSSVPIMPCFVLTSPVRFLISVLMLSILPLYAVNLVLYCVAHLHLKWAVIDHRYQTQIVITPFFPPALLLNTHTFVYCSECLCPMCFSNLSSNQSP